MNLVKTFLFGIVIGLGIISSILIGFYIAFGLNNKEIIKLEQAESIGTVMAALISLVGIVLLYKTYKSQQQELRATQEALRLQKTDSAFFNMLSLLQEIIKAMSDNVVKNREGYERIEGRAYLRKALEKLHGHFEHHTINMRPNPTTGRFNFFNPSVYFITGKEEDKDTEIVNYEHSFSHKELLAEVAKKYEEFYKDHQQNLGHYFRYVYNIIKYILDTSNRLSREDQKRYLGILQSQLSNDEMGLIFYNVLSKHGRSSKGEYKFLRLLDDHGLLENMDGQSLKEEWHHWFFPQTTFKFLDEEERERKIQYQTNLAKFNLP